MLLRMVYYLLLIPYYLLLITYYINLLPNACYMQPSFLDHSTFPLV